MGNDTRDTQRGKAAKQQDPEGDAPIEGSWEVFIGKGLVRQTFSGDGNGSYYAYKVSGNYPARWSGGGNHVTMRGYGTLIHYANDDPAIFPDLSIHGNHISGA